MKISNLKILFLLSKIKLNRQEKSPIRCRITLRGTRKIFSTGLFINPDHWDSKFQQVKPPNEENNFINTQLSLIKQNINQAFLFLQVNEERFDVNDLYNQYKGKTLQKEYGVIEIYSLYLERIKKLIDIELQMVTYKKYEESLTHLKGFIKWKYKTSDVKLNSIKFSFITEYEYYLKVEKNFQLSTLNKAIQRFRKIISFAIGNNHLDKDPFMLYKAKRQKKEVIYLTKEELSNLEEQDFEIQRVQQIKDLFVFCCYTGLGFKEMSNLKKTDIVEGFDNELWIDIKRAKTQRSYKVPLMQQAKDVLEKYTDLEGEYALPRMSNPKFNAYLKEIADVVKIRKNLTHHLARKTFATTVLLYNDVPMEIVSELLGHSKMSITQEHYGKVVQTKVSEHMIKLSLKLDVKKEI